MKIIISQQQWEEIGIKAGWKTAQFQKGQLEIWEEEPVSLPEIKTHKKQKRKLRKKDTEPLTPLIYDSKKGPQIGIININQKTK